MNRGGASQQGADAAAAIHEASDAAAAAVDAAATADAAAAAAVDAAAVADAAAATAEAAAQHLADMLNNVNLNNHGAISPPHLDDQDEQEEKEDANVQSPPTSPTLIYADPPLDHIPIRTEGVELPPATLRHTLRASELQVACYNHIRHQKKTHGGKVMAESYPAYCAICQRSRELTAGWAFITSTELQLINLHRRHRSTNTALVNATNAVNQHEDNEAENAGHDEEGD